MAKAKGAMHWAANFVGLSAGLHLLALVVGGFSAEALQLLPFAIVYGGFAYGLLQGWRWLAHISFIALMIGTSLAIVGIWALGDVPGWVYTGIVVANLLSVTALFVALWKAPHND